VGSGGSHALSERSTAATASSCGPRAGPAAGPGFSPGRQSTTFSMASLGTVRTGSLSPPPPLSGPGHMLVSPRRFSSRHVPHAAEELAQNALLPPDVASRLQGLTRHLKQNSSWDDRQRQVMDSTAQQLIPEEYDETLCNEFERRCAFGERMNTEFMSSAKWVKLLREVGAIEAGEKACKAGSQQATGTMSLAEADIIFRKVLHHCDYGGKRLAYGPFCKALALAALAARPDLDSEAAVVEMVARVSAAAPEESRQPDGTVDYMLDANVLLVLDHFKPALWDLFKSFCGRNLGNAAGPPPGAGTVRNRERSFWRHTQDTLLSSMASPTRGPGASLGEMSPGSEAASPMRHAHAMGALGGRSPAREPGGSPRTLGTLEELEREMPSPRLNSEADAGGGFTTPRRRSPHHEEPSLGERRASLPSLSPGGTEKGWHLSPQTTARSLRTSMSGSMSPSSQDPYLYANGAPVIHNRRQNMSADQFLSFCRELKIMPGLLTRLECARIFKRAQSAGSHSSHGSSLYGFLSREGFVDAAGQLAVEAYSKEPLCDEFPAAHEKVHDFFVRFLPSNSQEVHDRFLYGCAGRGR